MEFSLVFAGLDDADLLVKHRLGLLLEVHPELETKIQESEIWTRDWIRKRLSDGELIGLLAKADDGKVVGSGCIWLRDDLPRPTNPRMVAPYLMSMYTTPEFRRKGGGKVDRPECPEVVQGTRIRKGEPARVRSGEAALREPGVLSHDRDEGQALSISDN